MTSIKFTICLIGIYTGYYAILIVWDNFRNRRSDGENAQPELTFAEDIAPIQSHFNEPAGNTKESPVVFSGGVSLKELFNLAREESVEFIKSVSF